MGLLQVYGQIDSHPSSFPLLATRDGASTNTAANIIIIITYHHLLTTTTKPFTREKPTYTLHTHTLV